MLHPLDHYSTFFNASSIGSLFHIFQRFIHWNFSDSSIFNCCHNGICRHADHKHFHENLRIYVKCDPAGNACQHHFPEQDLHDFQLQWQADQDEQHDHDRRGHNVQPADFAVCISQDFCHGNRLRIFLDDDLGQEINQYEENDHGKSVHQIHHISHGHVELSRNLGQILNINGGTDIFFINIRNFRIREISAEAVFVHVKCFVEFLYWHKYGE